MGSQPNLVCIVDDDESVRRALGRVVHSFGYDVQLHSSARDCLDGHSVAKASCLIVDVSMPDMDGFELYALLKDSGRDIPTIFISAFDNEQNARRAMSAGGVAFLNKTHVTSTLQDVIEKAIFTRN